MTDLDRLVMEIETDGTITPHDAIRQAAEVLVEHFQVVAGNYHREHDRCRRDAAATPVLPRSTSRRSTSARALPTRSSTMTSRPSKTCSSYRFRTARAQGLRLQGLRRSQRQDCGTRLRCGEDWLYASPRISGRKLQLAAGPRRALVRGQLTSLVLHEAITTTEAKAKEVAPQFERLVTYAKKGTLAGGRALRAELLTENAVQKLLQELVARLRWPPGWLHPHC